MLQWVRDDFIAEMVILEPIDAETCSEAKGPTIGSGVDISRRLRRHSGDQLEQPAARFSKNAAEPSDITCPWRLRLTSEVSRCQSVGRAGNS